MLKFYLDETMKQEISEISWKGSVTISLVNGDKVHNAYMIGDIAKAVFYVVNDSENNFGVTALKMPDERILASIASPWIYPHRPVKVELLFPIKDEIVIQGNKIEIKGYYVIYKKGE